MTESAKVVLKGGQRVVAYIRDYPIPAGADTVEIETTTKDRANPMVTHGHQTVQLPIVTLHDGSQAIEVENFDVISGVAGFELAALER